MKPISPSEKLDVVAVAKQVEEDTNFIKYTGLLPGRLDAVTREYVRRQIAARENGTPSVVTEERGPGCFGWLLGNRARR